MVSNDDVDRERSRRLILSVSGVLRAAEPATPAWQIRVHELARLLERAAQADPHQPLAELVATKVQLTVVARGHS
jgi:hypothetical protein